MMKNYDVIVIGGSAAGLQATLTLSRSLISVLCIDSDKPCNRYANESHNFIGNDGSDPLKIKNHAWDQIDNYPNATLIKDVVEDVNKDSNGLFELKTRSNLEFSTKKLLFASGLNDNIEKIDIKNIEKFWGNFVIACPFCHGYEFHGKKTGIYYTNKMLLEMMLPKIYNWSSDLTVFCPEQVFESLESKTVEKLKSKNIKVVKNSVMEVNGDTTLSKVILTNGESMDLDVLYIIPPSTVNNKEILINLGVELDNWGLVKVDSQQNTNMPGIKAAGDCTTMIRALALAASQGLIAGSSLASEAFHEKWEELDY